MFSSLRGRLWLSYALIVITALSVVAMTLFVYLLRNPFSYRQTLERLRVVQAVILNDKGESLTASAERAAQLFGVRVLLYSQDRLVVLDTSSDTAPALSFPEKGPLARRTQLMRDQNGGTWLYLMEKLPDDTYLMVAAPRPRVSVLNVFTDDFLPLFVQSGLIALFLSLFSAFFFSRWIADPLQKVVQAVREMPAEAKPVEARGPQEVQELTRAFNSMIARTQAGQRSQREFVANISHELKTPLTSIQGFSQAILDGTADSPEKRNQAAQVIYDEAARMHRMVLDLLDLARLDAGTADITMSSVNMAGLLNAIVEKFSPQSQKAGVEIVLNASADLPALLADGDRLSQVFANLVDNALKFTPRGGSINLHAAVQKDEMHVSVADTGMGVSPEAQAHIFERFFQADQARAGGKGHGSGLGLAIAREIVQAHGGRISVRSRLGEGTTFEVFLRLKKK